MRAHALLIGAQRCGTTFLAELLDADERIAMNRPTRPEPKAFLDDAVLVAGADDYRRRLFGHATDELVLGEKSTSYIERPEAIARVRALLGEPVVIAQLRDPVARAVSNYRFTRSFGLEDRSLVVALSENLLGPRPWDPDLTSVSPYAYLERGRYVEHLEPWLAAFSTSHVCFLEEMVDPTLSPGAVAGVYDALGLELLGEPRAPRPPVNASDGERQELPASLLAELRDYFADSDAALTRLLGRDLPWAAEATTTRES